MKKKRKVIEVYYYSNNEDDFLLEAIFDVKENDNGKEVIGIEFFDLMQKHAYLGVKTVFKVAYYNV